MADQPKLTTVGVMFERKYGNDTIRFSFTQYTEIGNEEHVASRLGSVSVRAMDNFNSVAYASSRSSGHDMHTGGSDAVTFRVNRISSEVKRGKRYIKAHGGRFSKYGLAIYEEHWPTMGIDPATVTPEGVEPRGELTATVEKQASGLFKIVGLANVERETRND